MQTLGRQLQRQHLLGAGARIALQQGQVAQRLAGAPPAQHRGQRLHVLQAQVEPMPGHRVHDVGGVAEQGDALGRHAVGALQDQRPAADRAGRAQRGQMTGLQCIELLLHAQREFPGAELSQLLGHDLGGRPHQRDLLSGQGQQRQHAPIGGEGLQGRRAMGRLAGEIADHRCLAVGPRAQADAAPLAHLAGSPVGAHHQRGMQPGAAAELEFPAVLLAPRLGHRLGHRAHAALETQRQVQRSLDGVGLDNPGQRLHALRIGVESQRGTVGHDAHALHGLHALAGNLIPGAQSLQKFP